jgi:hypothetical protein
MAVTQGMHVRSILFDPCAYLISSADGPVAGDKDINIVRHALEQPQPNEGSPQSDSRRPGRGTDDQSECIVIERYRDSEAAIEHAANLADVSAAVLETVSVVHGELLGEPRAELRAKLADSEVPQLFTLYESM